MFHVSLLPAVCLSSRAQSNPMLGMEHWPASSGFGEGWSPPQQGSMCSLSVSQNQGYAASQTALEFGHEAESLAHPCPRPNMPLPSSIPPIPTPKRCGEFPAPTVQCWHRECSASEVQHQCRVAALCWCAGAPPSAKCCINTESSQGLRP